MRRALVSVICGAAVVIVLCSPQFGRAQTLHSYRPDLPPDALTCRPLPGGTRLPFGYQVRSDRDVERRGRTERVLRIQYDQTDTAVVRAALRDLPGLRHLTLTPLPVAGYVVSGTAVLRLRPTPTLAAPGCDSPYATKDFPADWKQPR